jgi:hypothetical protein
VLIGPRSEGNHLVVGPVRELYIDFGGFLFPIGVHRLHVQNRGLIHYVPPLHSKSLSPSGGFFVLVLSTKSNLVSRNSFLKKNWEEIS